MHDPLLDIAPGPAVPIDQSVLVARDAFAGAIADLLAIPDGALEAPWTWRSTDAVDQDVRYGLYRIHERLAAAIGAIAVGRAGLGSGRIGPAVPALEATSVARWDVQGVMRSVDDDSWDMDPGGGEWTVRQTMGHIIAGQRSYGWYNAWYLHLRAPEGEVASFPPDEFMPPEPAEAEESAGTPATVLAALDAIVDQNVVAYAGLDDAAMRVPARWSQLPVTIDFRLGRYGSHIREHTVQIDKTLAMLGRQPSEVERLVRLAMGTYGQLEAALLGRSPDVLAASLAGGSTATGILRAAVAEVVETAARLRATVS